MDKLSSIASSINSLLNRKKTPKELIACIRSYLDNLSANINSLSSPSSNDAHHSHSHSFSLNQNNDPHQHSNNLNDRIPSPHHITSPTSQNHSHSHTHTPLLSSVVPPASPLPLTNSSNSSSFQSNFPTTTNQSQSQAQAQTQTQNQNQSPNNTSTPAVEEKELNVVEHYLRMSTLTDPVDTSNNASNNTNNNPGSVSPRDREAHISPKISTAPNSNSSNHHPNNNNLHHNSNNNANPNSTNSTLPPLPHSSTSAISHSMSNPNSLITGNNSPHTATRSISITNNFHNQGAPSPTLHHKVNSNHYNTLPHIHTHSHTNSGSSNHNPNDKGILEELDTCVILLYGEPDGSSKPNERVVEELTSLIFEHNILKRLLDNIKSLDFESRKLFTRIFEFCMQQRRDQSISYIQYQPVILTQLVANYEERDVAIVLCSDAILRACISCWPLAEIVFNSPELVEAFFKYMDLPNFDVGSHAFSTFKLLMTEHPDLVSNFLNQNYDKFCALYNGLLQSDNYLTKLQSFQLLCEILMNPSNHDFMMKYVNVSENLKISMISLRGPKAIQMAVFHVLKIFIPNPYKSDAIIKILVQNKKNFCAFLDDFQRDTDDPILASYKEQMLTALYALPDSIKVNISPTGGPVNAAKTPVQSESSYVRSNSITQDHPDSDQ